MKTNITEFLKEEKPSELRKVILVLAMSVPAILAQLTSIAMQYIDAGMVGSLGAKATGAIGVVTSSTWLIGGSVIGLASGFSVQVAQLVGAGRQKEASETFRQGMQVLFALSIVLTTISMSISHYLPVWLHADPELVENAGRYFFIWSIGLPFGQMRQLSASMLQCSGDMKTPSAFAACVCLLDVIFNRFLIFETSTVSIFGQMLTIPGAGLGVTGAAIGTALAEVVVSTILLYIVCFRSPILNIRQEGSWKLRRNTIGKAFRIAIPVTLDHTFMCGAQVAATSLVAPLGTLSVAANTLAITAESFCYLPGFGIAAAATAIIGQSIGADRKDLTKVFSKLTVLLGMLFMGLTGALMYVICPFVFGLLTSDPTVAALGTKALRIELLVEPLYAAAIVCVGVFRGAGDTFVPTIFNLICMWGVRIMFARFLIPIYGLNGYWIAMATELGVRGLVLLLRLRSGRWMKKSLVEG